MLVSDLPLAGVRIIDFTWVGAGPLTTRILADFGAEVIKIESRSRPDVLRITPPLSPTGSEYERSGYFAARNANKKSVALDMTKEAGRDIARRLIRSGDVVANSFAPGVMERWGFGYEDVIKFAPEIVYLEMPMLGSEGPYKDFSGFGATLLAVSGMLHLCGYPDRQPTGTGTNYPDHVPNPMHAAFAVLAALIEKRKSGKGQKIEVSQLESTINVIGSAFVMQAQGHEAARTGNSSAAHSLHGAYPCAGDDRWVAISVKGEKQWQGLSEVLRRPDLLANPMFETLDGRVEHRAALEAIVAAWTRLREPREAMLRLQEAGIAASVVNDAQTLMDQDENAEALGLFKALPHAEMGPSRYMRAPVRMSRTDARLDTAAPLLGEHTEEVCRELLGMSVADIEASHQSGAFG